MRLRHTKNKAFSPPMLRASLCAAPAGQAEWIHHLTWAHCGRTVEPWLLLSSVAIVYTEVEENGHQGKN